MLCSAQENLGSEIKLQELSKVEDIAIVTEILNKETINEWDDILQMRKDVYGTLNAEDKSQSTYSTPNCRNGLSNDLKEGICNDPLKRDSLQPTSFSIPPNERDKTDFPGDTQMAPQATHDIQLRPIT